MVKLSNYSSSYEEGKFELMPWEFWTDEEKSQVIYEAYKQHYLTSKEVKPYLDIARKHMYTQFAGPVVSALVYYGFLKYTLAWPLYRRSPTLGFRAGAAFVTLSSILWLNLSPYYLNKQSGQEQTLDLLYHKIGTSMKLLNDLVPRTRTSTDIDIRTRMLYSKRNGALAGILFAEDDYAPPILTQKIVNKYNAKKVFL